MGPGVPVAERVAGAAAGMQGLAAIIALDNGSLPAGETDGASAPTCRSAP